MASRRLLVFLLGVSLTFSLTTAASGSGSKKQDKGKAVVPRGIKRPAETSAEGENERAELQLFKKGTNLDAPLLWNSNSISTPILRRPISFDLCPDIPTPADAFLSSLSQSAPSTGRPGLLLPTAGRPRPPTGNQFIRFCKTCGKPFSENDYKMEYAAHLLNATCGANVHPRQLRQAARFLVESRQKNRPQ